MVSGNEQTLALSATRHSSFKGSMVGTMVPLSRLTKLGKFTTGYRWYFYKHANS